MAHIVQYSENMKKKTAQRLKLSKNMQFAADVKIMFHEDIL